MDLIPPKFNRLSLFDPRVPHGVVPVHGVHDPREARIVLHGWFAEPEPYFEGEEAVCDCGAGVGRGWFAEAEPCFEGGEF